MDKTKMKELMAKRFEKALPLYDNEAFIQQKIAVKMTELLLKYQSEPFKRIAEFGCGTGFYSKLLYRFFEPEQLWLNDICAESVKKLEIYAKKKATFHAGDAEQIDIPTEQQLITGCSVVQWFDNPQNFFDKCYYSLAAGGLLAFTSFGKNNLREIRQLTGQGLHYFDLSEYEKMIERNYKILYSEQETISPNFDSPMDVLQHIRKTGVSGVSQYVWTRSKLNDFCKSYLQYYASPKGVSLTYQPIYIIAKSK